MKIVQNSLFQQKNAVEKRKIINWAFNQAWHMKLWYSANQIEKNEEQKKRVMD